jgi:sarcosine oxidase
MKTLDAIVLGLGGVGAQALRVLGQRGARVVGLERFGRAHDRGSSHGATRVTRHAYFEHPDYVPLLRAATAGFQDLESATGAPLLDACGVVLLGPSGSAVVRASAAAAERWGVPVERLDAAEFRRRFPAFRVDDGDEGLWEPGGGFVRPEASIRAALADAESHGASVRTGAAVRGIEEDTDEVRVHLDGETLRARALVVAAGAWTPQVLPSLRPLLRITRQVQGWVRPEDPAQAAPSALPCWLIDRGAAPPLYGVPVDPLAPGPPLAKVAVHGSDWDVSPDHLHRSVGPDERGRLASLAGQHVPGLRGPLLAARTCMYTQTRDEHFIVDRLPGRPRTVVVAGLSGHGFKLTPALGRVAAELCLDGETELPIGFLGLGRFRR